MQTTKVYKPEDIRGVLQIANDLSKDPDNTIIMVVMCYKANRIFIFFERVSIRQYETLLIEYINGCKNKLVSDETIIQVSQNRARREFEKSNLKK